MTEEKWLACTNLTMMLELLRESASDRKLRLFGLACCRRILPLMTDERSRHAVEVVEAYLDGTADRNALEEARRGARAAVRQIAAQRYPSSYHRRALQKAAESVAELTSKKVGKVVCSLARAAVEAAAESAGLEGAQRGVSASARAAKVRSELEQQRALLLECFGPRPFRAAAIEPSWLAWCDGTVPKVAQALYEERAFDRLPILADALEDAGCDDGAILAHLRGPGPHIRGCWALDTILGCQ